MSRLGRVVDDYDLPPGELQHRCWCTCGGDPIDPKRKTCGDRVWRVGATSTCDHPICKAIVAGSPAGELMKEKKKTTQIVVRIPDDLLSQLDALVAKKCALLPGLNYTRSDAVRQALMETLMEKT